MPPEVKITKDMLLNTAFKITKEKGFENVTARKLAKELSCSTQPIFRLYANMDALKEDLIVYGNLYFNSYLKEAYEGKDPLLNISLSYINFSMEERPLFRMMFMSPEVGENIFDSYFSDPALDIILRDTGYGQHLSVIELRVIFMQMWIFAHGIATMIVSNNVSMDSDDVLEIMTNTLNQLIS